MSTIGDYGGILAFVTDHLELDSATEAQLPNLLRLGELKLKRKLESLSRETVVTSATTADVRTLALPTGMMVPKVVVLDDDYLLAQTSLTELERVYGGTDTGRPEVFAIADGAFYFGPIPDAAYSIAFTYDAELTPLSSTETTNWLTDEDPDAYVYMLMAEAEAFRGNLEAGASWLALAESVIDEINGQARSARKTDFSAPAEVEYF